MLTPREAFKVGFLRRCADAGMTAEETHYSVKQATAMLKSGIANELLMKPYQTTLDVAGGTAKSLGNLGIWGALIGPAAVGGAAGYGLSRLTDIDDTDVDAIKTRELIDEYHRQRD